jgi:Cu2+-exporting ATPase
LLDQTKEMSKATLIASKHTTHKKSKPIIYKESFPVLEMTCAACAISVESMLKSVSGVVNAGVNFANQSAWVEYDHTSVTPEKL